MNNTNIVPNKHVKSLTPHEIQTLCTEVAEITAVYEEANTSLEELEENMYSLERAGEKYNELTSSVRNKIASCCSKGVIGKVLQ